MKQYFLIFTLSYCLGCQSQSIRNEQFPCDIEALNTYLKGKFEISSEAEYQNDTLVFKINVDSSLMYHNDKIYILRNKLLYDSYILLDSEAKCVENTKIKLQINDSINIGTLYTYRRHLEESVFMYVNYPELGRIRNFLLDSIPAIQFDYYDLIIEENLGIQSKSFSQIAQGFIADKMTEDKNDNENTLKEITNIVEEKNMIANTDYILSILRMGNFIKPRNFDKPGLPWIQESDSTNVDYLEYLESLRKALKSQED
ncbi:MAG: hypothetical protein ABJN36_08825 [Cyclobacteriaceae bacterium]